MTPTEGDHVATLVPGLDEQKAQRLKRFTHSVTIVMILVCNAVFLLGLWGSGINLDELTRSTEVFNPEEDICVRLGWHKVVGVQQTIRLCQDWLKLSDPSGQTHNLNREVEVVQGADGKLYYDHGVRVDYRLFLLGGVVMAITAIGVLFTRFFIARYRTRLESPGGMS